MEKKLNNKYSFMAFPPESLPQFVISCDGFDRNLNSTYLNVSIVTKLRMWSVYTHKNIQQFWFWGGFT